MPIKVIIDYKSPKYFMTTKKHIRCQACWIQFLLRFNFIISYTMSKTNAKTDTFIYHSNNNLANDYDNQ